MLLKYQIQKIVLICTISIIPIMFISVGILTSFIEFKFSILNSVLFLALVYSIYTKNIEYNKHINNNLEEFTELSLGEASYQEVYKFCEVRNSSFPKLLLDDSDSIKAYTIKNSKKQYCIVISNGLIELINKDELKAVFIHELAHLYKKDFFYTKLIKLIIFILPFVLLFSRIKDETLFTIVILLLLIVISVLVQFFLFSLFQKVTEYEADLIAGMYLNTTSLITLFEKLEIKTIPMTEVKFSIERFFQSHPTLKNRIKKLKQI